MRFPVARPGEPRIIPHFDRRWSVTLGAVPLNESSADQRSLASALAPALREANGGRLSDLSWFRTDWQRGGAATGYALWRGDDGASHRAVVKLPVNRRELLWLQRLQDPGLHAPVPALYSAGDSIGGYDLAWVVMERLPAGPLGQHWHNDHVPRLVDALAHFHAACARWPVEGPVRREDWREQVDDALETCRQNPVPEAKRWQAALRQVRDRLHELIEIWDARPAREWLHGDAHFANALSRGSVDAGPVVLIDLAEVHVGHWVEDAIYVERQLWAKPELLAEHKPFKALAAARRRLGLPVDEGDSRLALVRRVLLAATAPHYLRSEGHPRHLMACLEWVERGLKDLPGR